MKIRAWTRSPFGKRRARTLLILAFTAVALAGSYWLLGWLITAGEKQLAAGQSRIAEAAPVMEKGKDKLEAGKLRLSEGKEDYGEAMDNQLLVWVDDALNDGKGFEKARERIAEGERKVAAGEEKISDGEDRIDAGKRKLRLGRKGLFLVKIVRVACAVGTFLLAALTIVLGSRWRR